MIEPGWQELQKPKELEDNLFLLVAPEQIVYQDFRFTNAGLETALGLRFVASVGDSIQARQWNPARSLPPLSKISQVPKSNVSLNLPVHLAYDALEKHVHRKVNGKVIRAKNRNGKMKSYARVEGIMIRGSDLPGYDVVIGLRLKMLRTAFKKQRPTFYFHAVLDYDSTKREIFIRDFKLDAETRSGLVGRALEFLANQVVYNRVIEKMIYSPEAVLRQQRELANSSLKSGVRLMKGVGMEGLLSNMYLKELHSMAVSVDDLATAVD